MPRESGAGRMERFRSQNLTPESMSGHGFKLAPAVGEMMAALITGSTPPVSPAPFRLARFAGRPAGGTFVSSYLG